MKLETIHCNRVFIPAMICIFTSGISWKVAAQTHAPKPAKAIPKKVPIKKQNADAEKLVNVATIHISDGSAAKVRKTFKAANIPVLVMGSKNYGVLVREKDHDRALSLLKVDSKKQHYWIKLGR